MSTKFLIGTVALLAVSGITTTVAQSRCVNPNGRKGICISVYDCPSLASEPDQDKNFLLQSQCSGGSGREPHVCCNEDAGFVTTTAPPIRLTGSSTSQATIYPSLGQGDVLPSPPNCGKEPTASKKTLAERPRELGVKRIYNGRNAGIDQFAWMVVLEYIDATGKKTVNCGGSLINTRYVATAAHCVTGKILTDVGPLVSVRLGEYNIGAEEDCVKNICADPVVISEIEEVIPHENFDGTTDSRHNDIALIRLNRDVNITDFIQPVCLPSSTEYMSSPEGTELTVAGWGRTLFVKQSSIKQKLEIPVTDQNDCAQKYSSKNVELLETQLCAGGRFAEDSCDGDSGGPLMKLVNNNWVLEGIVSFGFKCGLENWPAVYTRVASFEPWIKSKLRP